MLLPVLFQQYFKQQTHYSVEINMGSLNNKNPIMIIKCQNDSDAKV